MPYLSRDDIEKIAGHITEQYKQACVPERHMCYNVDPVALASLFGFHIEYVNITRDGSILGQTSSSSIWTTIVGPDIENNIQLSFRCYNITICEISEGSVYEITILGKMNTSNSLDAK